MARDVNLTGVERFFDKDELIVSKTDTKGIVTYANDVFLRIASYRENQVLGKNHNLIRHPDMPRCVFKLLWDTISAGEEIFAYVLNRAANGDHYWVLAHVTPTFDENKNIVEYHSSRRVPTREAIDKITPIYKSLLDVEKQHTNPKEGLKASWDALMNFVEQNGGSYGRIVFSL